jgi:hypothetical protein
MWRAACTAIFLLCLLFGQSTDPCSFASQDVLSWEDGMNCIQAVPFNETWRQNHLAVARSVYAEYTFQNLVKYNPEWNQFVDIESNLSTIESKTYSHDWDFENDVVLSFLQLHDAHTQAILPQCYYFFQLLPFGIYAKKVEKLHQSTVGIFFGESYTIADAYQTMTGINVDDYLNVEIAAVNGIPVVDYINQLADEMQYISNDPAVRFNEMIKDGFSQRFLAFNGANMDGHVNITTYSSSGEVTVRWPFVLYPTFGSTSTSQMISMCQCGKTTCSATTEQTVQSFGAKAAGRDALLQDSTERMRRRELEVEEHSTFLKATSHDDNVVQAYLLKHADAVQGSSFLSLLSRRKSHTDDYTSKLYEELNEGDGEQNILKVSADANEDIVLYFVGDDTAVIAITTFAPNSVTDFVQAFRSAYEIAVNYGKTKLVLDVSGNGGGYVCLGFRFVSFLLQSADYPIYEYDLNTDSPKFSYPIDNYIGRIGYGKYNLIHSKLNADIIDYVTQQNPSAVLEDAFLFSNFDPYAIFNLDEDQPYGAFSTSYYSNGPTRLSGQTNTQFSKDFGLYCPADLGDSLVNPGHYFDSEHLTILTDGTCGSTCNLFVTSLYRMKAAKVIGYGGLPRETLEMASFAGGSVVDAEYFVSTQSELSAVGASLSFPPFTSTAAVPASVTTFDQRVNYMEMMDLEVTNKPNQFVKKPVDILIPYYPWNIPASNEADSLYSQMYPYLDDCASWQSHTCTVPNGIGSQSCVDGSFSGTCLASSCNAGYDLQSGSCVPTSAQTSSSSSINAIASEWDKVETGNTGTALATVGVAAIIIGALLVLVLLVGVLIVIALLVILLLKSKSASVAGTPVTTPVTNEDDMQAMLINSIENVEEM